MLLAQITDLHMRRNDTPLSGAVVTRPYIVAAVDALLERRPDVVFVTGDLTDIGTAEEYALLRAELDRLPMPVLIIPGNHDRREVMRSAFADHAYLPSSGPLNWVVEDFDLRIIGLDSVVPGAGHGELVPDTLEWLDATLGESERPTLIGVHHPPFAAALPGMDVINLKNGNAFASVVEKHAHVVRVVCGHYHRSTTLAWAGTIAQIAPSVAHQVSLDFSERTSADWVMEPPAYLLHCWDGSGPLISHHVYIGAYGGAKPFRLDPDYPGGTVSGERALPR